MNAFVRPHHRRIATVLTALDGALLAQHHCWFGGGTAIALRYGEYRESVDIDFMVSDLAGYRVLRQLLTGPEGLAPITRPGGLLLLLREVRADQYGIRTMIDMDAAPIKFEIVLEARVQFDPPKSSDSICGIATLTPLDLTTSKLLANADRWRDDAVLSRDLIDLAMMAPPKALLGAALAKARGAYGGSIDTGLQAAVDMLRQRPQRLADCMGKMAMHTISPAALWHRIRALERRAKTLAIATTAASESSPARR